MGCSVRRCVRVDTRLREVDLKAENEKKVNGKEIGPFLGATRGRFRREIKAWGERKYMRIINRMMVANDSLLFSRRAVPCVRLHVLHVCTRVCNDRTGRQDPSRTQLEIPLRALLWYLGARWGRTLENALSGDRIYRVAERPRWRYTKRCRRRWNLEKILAAYLTLVIHSCELYSADIQ